MLKIRLKRVGRKHDPSFRVVLIDSKLGPKSNKINEILGFYDPKKDIKELKAEEIKSWISKGAQVSDTVHNLLVDQKIIEGKKINVLPQKSPVAKEEEKKEETSKEEAPKEEETSTETETPAPEKKKEEKLEEARPETKSEETPAVAPAPAEEKAQTETQTKEPQKGNPSSVSEELDSTEKEPK